MPVSKYVKRLLKGSLVDGVGRSINLVLDRLEAINVSIGTHSGAQNAAPAVPLFTHGLPLRALTEEKLRVRGLPSSTIRLAEAA